MKAPEIKSGRKRKGESGKEREGKGEERGGKGEERGGKGERERDKQQWGGETCGWVAPLFACELFGRGDVFHGTRN